MRLGKSKEVSVDEENPYWMSFSDIMSALLVIFILASVILILQLMEIQRELTERQVQFEQELVELKKAEQVRRTILDEAVEALRERGIKVEVSENHTGRVFPTICWVSTPAHMTYMPPIRRVLWRLVRSSMR